MRVFAKIVAVGKDVRTKRRGIFRMAWLKRRKESKRSALMPNVLIWKPG